MSFFYGVKDVTVSNSTNLSPMDKTILPGHNFQDPYMTGAIAVIAVTIFTLIISWILLSRMKVEDELDPQDAAKGIESRFAHPTWGAEFFCFLFIFYFAFELTLRICTERRLTVPYAFVAIDIPARFILMISDLVCYGIAAVSGGWPMRCRLNDLRNGFFWYLFQFLAYIGGFAIGISLVAERISYIVMMVGQGFRWDKADSTYYAFARVVYTGGMLFLMVLVWVCNIRLYFMYLMRRRNPDFIDRCGKLPALWSFVVCPLLTLRFATAFFFTFYFRFQKRPQNPNLELPRMILNCVPLMIIGICFVFMRRIDVRIKAKEEEREYLLHSVSHSTTIVKGGSVYQGVART